jgi:hypothetical protein
MMTSNYFYYVTALFIFLILYHICKLAKRPIRNYWTSHSNDAGTDVTHTTNAITPSTAVQIQTVDPVLTQELRNRRFQMILEGVIHKKVKSKSENIEDADIVEDNSCTSIREIPSGDSDCMMEKDSERMEKSDLLIETLRSIRDGLHLNINSTDVDYSSKTCTICCEDYKSGDDIVWSRNRKCKHAFHTECIIQWLMDHDDCPMCRNKYLEAPQ